MHLRRCHTSPTDSARLFLLRVATLFTCLSKLSAHSRHEQVATNERSFKVALQTFNLRLLFGLPSPPLTATSAFRVELWRIVQFLRAALAVHPPDLGATWARRAVRVCTTLETRTRPQTKHAG